MSTDPERAHQEAAYAEWLYEHRDEVVGNAVGLTEDEAGEYTGPVMVSMSFRIDQDEAQAIRDKAAHAGMSVSAFIRGACQAWDGTSVTADNPALGEVLELVRDIRSRMPDAAAEPRKAQQGRAGQGRAQRPDMTG